MDATSSRAQRWHLVRRPLEGDSTSVVATKLESGKIVDVDKRGVVLLHDSLGAALLQLRSLENGRVVWEVDDVRPAGRGGIGISQASIVCLRGDQIVRVQRNDGNVQTLLSGGGDQVESLACGDDVVCWHVGNRIRCQAFAGGWSVKLDEPDVSRIESLDGALHVELASGETKSVSWADLVAGLPLKDAAMPPLQWSVEPVRGRGERYRTEVWLEGKRVWTSEPLELSSASDLMKGCVGGLARCNTGVVVWRRTPRALEPSDEELLLLEK